MSNQIDRKILLKFQLSDKEEQLNLVLDKYHFCTLLELINEVGFEKIKDSKFSYEM